MDEKGVEGVCSPPGSAFPLRFSPMQLLFPNCTLTWRVDNYVFCRGKGKNRRNEHARDTDIGTAFTAFIENLTLSFSNYFKEIIVNSVLKHCYLFFHFFKHGNSEAQKMLAAINRENHEDHPRNAQARNASPLESTKILKLKCQKKIERRVTNKLSQELNRTKSRFLGALSQLYELLQNPQARVHSRNSSKGNQGANEDCSLNDSHPEREPP